MHILHISGTLGMGGAERLVLDLIACQQAEGHRVSLAVLAAADPGRPDQRVWEQRMLDLQRQGVHAVGLDVGTRSFVRARRLLRKHFHDVDVVHSHIFNGSLAATGLPGRPPIIWTLHAPFLGFPRPAAVVARPFVSQFVACSPHVAQAFEPLLGTRLVTIVNGVSRAQYSSRPRPVSPPGSLRLVALGGVKPVKNYPRLIRAVALARPRLEDHGVNVELTIVGDGEDRPSVERAILEHGLQDKVVLAGMHAVVNPFLDEADVFVMSSDFEGLPIAMLEAMSAGLPVVTTPVAGAAELLGDAGLVADGMDDRSLADVLVTMGLDRDLQARSSTEARSRSAVFDIANCARDYEQVYRGFTTAR